MRIDGVADHFSNELINQNDADVTASQEAPGGRNRKSTGSQQEVTLAREFNDKFKLYTCPMDP